MLRLSSYSHRLLLNLTGKRCTSFVRLHNRKTLDTIYIPLSQGNTALPEITGITELELSYHINGFVNLDSMITLKEYQQRRKKPHLETVWKTTLQEHIVQPLQYELKKHQEWITIRSNKEEEISRCEISTTLDEMPERTVWLIRNLFDTVQPLRLHLEQHHHVGHFKMWATQAGHPLPLKNSHLQTIHPSLKLHQVGELIEPTQTKRIHHFLNHEASADTEVAIRPISTAFQTSDATHQRTLKHLFFDL